MHVGGRAPDFASGRRVRHVHRVPAEPASVSAARHWLRALCGATVSETACHDAELVLTELVSNAVRASTETISIEVHVPTDTGKALRLLVRDGSPRPVQLRAPGPWAEGGRGLLLVDQLATRWGAFADSTGKTVWADVR
jgi:anti-sigma regulatory factor (Ser/Thr protein kinase)